MTNADYIRLTAQIAVLKDIATEYSGKTINNIIQQLEARKAETEKYNYVNNNIFYCNSYCLRISANSAETQNEQLIPR